MDNPNVVYVDNGYLMGWYFQKEGEYYGDGTKKGAIETAERMSENDLDITR